MKQKKTQKKAPSEPSMLDIANAPKAATQVERDVERMMATPGLARLITDTAARERFNGITKTEAIEALDLERVELRSGLSWCLSILRRLGVADAGYEWGNGEPVNAGLRMAALKKLLRGEK